tara:strand:- start:1663 stop:2058 length:396 start_codon:yes stop_codon:yes gene_type:complete
MATEGGGLGPFDISMEATATLATKQYFAVIADSSNPHKCVIAGANGKVIGILQNKPAAGETAIVRTGGVSKHSMGEASMTPGDLVTATADGDGEQVDAAGEFFYGILLTNADDGDIASILVTQGVAHASDA